MARRISPIRSDRLSGFFETGALIEVHSYCVFEDISVNAIVNLKFNRAQRLVSIHYCVRPRGCDIGEIKPPNFVSRDAVRDAAIPNDWRTLLYNLAGLLINNGVGSARCEMMS